MSAEPYVVRRLGLAQLIPIVVFAAWLALLEVLGFDLPAAILAIAGAYILVSTALNLERLRIDEKGVRMRPASRIPWGHFQSATARDGHALSIRLKPGAPLPRGIRGMIDGELTLPARGFELEPARVDQAVRA